MSPPRYDVMTLRTGCDYDLGSGFPPDETIPDDRRVQLRGSLLWSEMFRFNDRFHLMYSPRLRDARANVSVRVRCDPSGF